MAIENGFPLVELPTNWDLGFRRRAELGNRAYACLIAENTDHAVLRRLEIEAWAFRAYTRALVSAMAAPPSNMSLPKKAVSVAGPVAAPP